MTDKVKENPSTLFPIDETGSSSSPSTSSSSSTSTHVSPARPSYQGYELRRCSTVEYIPRAHENRDSPLRPINAFVTPLLTDLYQVTMAYAYWKNGSHEDPSVFDLFFRKNPFGGEFTIFAGLEEVIRYVNSFSFRPSQIEQLKQVMPPGCDPEFYDWLATVDSSKVRVVALKEGSLVFPRIPMIRVEGPLAICQMLETTLLTLVNYPSLVATNAARHRLAAGPDKTLLEFGCRRAQGPDGAVSASRYAYIGGCDGTSDVLAGILFGIPVRGTHAHSFVTSFVDQRDLKQRLLLNKTTGEKEDFAKVVYACRDELGFHDTSSGELAAFTSYALAFPETTMCLVDTYDTLKSGVPNFLVVALALHRFGYKAIGVRLDSGDLAYLSRQTRKLFTAVGKKVGLDYFTKFVIAASNNINEETLISLKQQGHDIDTFGIGTNLVTCESQPALGCVYKLVEIRGTPRIKLSQEVSKVTLPGAKDVHRIYGAQGHPLVDIMVRAGSAPPLPNERVLCRHPFEEQKRAYVTPTRVVPLLHTVIKDGKCTVDLPSVEQIRDYVKEQIKEMRADHMRLLNPTPYKVSVTAQLYNFVHELWLEEAPIPDISFSDEVSTN
ncbi:Nicotinate phosphoribosyltransferase [Balamuthia mandrillaris]